MGSVFSPYYAWSGRRDPLDHCALNVALYRRGGGGRWAMTERGRRRVVRASDALQLGPSALWAGGDGLEVHIHERGLRRIAGRVRLWPEVQHGRSLLLSPAGAHHWWPIAPRGRVEVELDEPRLRWSGVGYLDCNWGAEPLEAGFRRWTWSRAPLAGGGAVVLYDAEPRRGEAVSTAMRFDRAGGVEILEPPAAVRLPRTMFWLPRATRSDDGEATVRRTLTDAHFYARSLVESRACGERVTAVHESLELDRFDTWWGKAMLPFRMPRRG